jgi:hypothetical protein
VTVVVAVALLFAGVLSLGEDRVAVLLSVVAVPGALTTIVNVAVVPAASVARVHVTVGLPEQLQPVPVDEMNVVPAGSGSDTLMELASIVELFVTPIV